MHACDRNHVRSAVLFSVQVLTCARKQDELEAALREWSSQGLNVNGIVADVSQRDDAAALVSKAREVFGEQLHVLVNNVGTNIRKPTVEYSQQDFQFIMSTNLESAYAMCQMCHPLLKAAGSSCIVFNSSVAGGPTAMRCGAAWLWQHEAADCSSLNGRCTVQQDV
jgi:Tropinone reductase 1